VSDPLPGRGVAVVYDGDCPLCAAYIRRLRLVAAAGEVHLFDARRHPDLRRSLAGEGLDPDRGMVVAVDGVRYHGARAMHVLAMLSGGSGVLNRLGYRLFRSATLARLLYPVLAAGRRALLALLGRPPLGDRP
jgi:predicted DCC family thiol-disulfide oxidoreductase YuxK